MSPNELKIFDQMPFLFWIKDRDGRYVWGNRVISELAGEDVVGKTDRQLVWAANADGLEADDREVFASGKPLFRHEYVNRSADGKATLNVCKWVGSFDGKDACFGISFVID